MQTYYTALYVGRTYSDTFRQEMQLCLLTGRIVVHLDGICSCAFGQGIHLYFDKIYYKLQLDAQNIAIIIIMSIDL